MNKNESFFAKVQRDIAHAQIEKWYGSLSALSEVETARAKTIYPGETYEVETFDAIKPLARAEPLFTHTCEYCGRRSMVAPLTSCAGCGAPPTGDVR